MKKLSKFLLVVILFSFTSTFADQIEGNVQENTSNIESNAGMQNSRVGMKKPAINVVNTKIKKNSIGFRKDLRELRSEKNGEIKTNRESMQNNRKNFRQENKDELKSVFGNIEESKKNELKSLNEKQKTEMKNLHDEYKGLLKDEEKREELKNKIDGLRTSYYQNIKILLSGNDDALELVEKRKNIFQQNVDLRKKNVEARIKFRGDRFDLIVEQKEKFIEKIGSRISKIPDSKLELLDGKIEKYIEKIDGNSKMSQDKKDSLRDKLIALKEIISEELDSTLEEVNILDSLNLD